MVLGPAQCNGHERGGPGGNQQEGEHGGVVAPLGTLADAETVEEAEDEGDDADEENGTENGNDELVVSGHVEEVPRHLLGDHAGVELGPVY